MITRRATGALILTTLWTVGAHAVTPRVDHANASANPPLAGRDPVRVQVSLDPGPLAGDPADWWLHADTPVGPFSWSPGGEWVVSDTPIALQAPLVGFDGYEVIDLLLPAGDYSIHFGVDGNQDGIQDMGWSDQLDFTVCPFSENLSLFESGNIGAIESSANGTQWNLAMRPDNDNCTLRQSWRTWWYAHIDPPTDTPVTIDLTNRGWPYYYLPVYSYDGVTWQRPSEAEVTQPDTYSLRIEREFAQPSVALARFYPYTLSDLNTYLAAIVGDPNVAISEIGQSVEGRAIEMVTLTDPALPDANKQRIWIHARSHPAETGGSFLLEGLIDFLLDGSEEARLALENLIFNIVPMHNVDGVVAGNYRTTPESRNLEVEWRRDLNDPTTVLASSAVEALVLQRTVAELAAEGPAFTTALNLHSSNSEPDIRPFFYPHFGPASAGYSASEAALWEKQVAFITQIARFHGTDLIEPLPSEGGSSFVTKWYPESWWWAAHADTVNAITVETTYGRAGYAPDWITPDHLRTFGANIAKALMAQHGLETRAMAEIAPVSEASLRQVERRDRLRYPERHPADDPDEGKE